MINNYSNNCVIQGRALLRGKQPPEKQCLFRDSVFLGFLTLNFSIDRGIGTSPRGLEMGLIRFATDVFFSIGSFTFLFSVGDRTSSSTIEFLELLNALGLAISNKLFLLGDSCRAGRVKFCSSSSPSCIDCRDGIVDKSCIESA